MSTFGLTAARATPPAGKASRTELAVGTVSENISIERSQPSDFHIQQVTIEPGATTGWHTHPGPEYSVLKAGSIVLQRSAFRACAPVTITAGQGWFIPAGIPHVARNVGSSPAELYVTYTVPTGTSSLRLDSNTQCGEK